MHRETKLETVSFLDSSGRSCGLSFRMADQRCHGGLRTNHCETASVSSRLALSHRLDAAVRTDGHWCGKGLSSSPLKDAESGTEPVCAAAGGKFFLESHLLQFAGIRVCFLLTAAVVGTGAVDDFCFPDGGSAGGKAADSIPALADFCSLSESGCLVSEPVKNAGLHRIVESGVCPVGDKITHNSFKVCYDKINKTNIIKR